MSHAQTVREILDRLAADGVEVKRLCADSRQVLAGDIFLASPGHRVDGRKFITDAVHAGAAAVLWEKDGYAWDASLDLPNYAVDGLAALSGYLANEVYGRPSESLWLVGVTGTNGKTSVSQWLARAFANLGRKCGVIGTLGIGFPGALSSSLNTTPDALTVHRTLADFRSAGALAVAMEVSSIGLDQSRLNGLHFDVAVFTNLTRDHLDREDHAGLADLRDVRVVGEARSAAASAQGRGAASGSSAGAPAPAAGCSGTGNKCEGTLAPNGRVALAQVHTFIA